MQMRQHLHVLGALRPLKLPPCVLRALVACAGWDHAWVCTGTCACRDTPDGLPHMHDGYLPRMCWSSAPSTKQSQQAAALRWLLVPMTRVLWACCHVPS